MKRKSAILIVDDEEVGLDRALNLSALLKTGFLNRPLKEPIIAAMMTPGISLACCQHCFFRVSLHLRSLRHWWTTEKSQEEE